MQISFNALRTLADLIIETGQLSFTPYPSRVQASVNPGYISKRSNFSTESKHSWSMGRSVFINVNPRDMSFW
jgi:hypothetical protein